MKQGIYEQSAVKLYPIGKRIAIDDRVFRYCHAGEALRPLMDGMNGNLSIEDNAAAAIYLAGTSQITIQMNPNSIHNAEEPLADYWKDGYIWILPDPFVPLVTGSGQLYRIKSSAPAEGGFVTATLYEPLIETVTASRWITAWPNIYSRISRCNVRMSLVCLPLIPVTLDNYFWGQTWGPMFVQCGLDPGRVDNDREAYYSSPHFGLVPGDSVDFTTPRVPQRAGYLLSNTSPYTNRGGVGQLGGDNFFMLQLAP